VQELRIQLLILVLDANIFLGTKKLFYRKGVCRIFFNVLPSNAYILRGIIGYGQDAHHFIEINAHILKKMKNSIRM